MSEVLEKEVYGELGDLDRYDRQKYILATILSTVPTGITFPHGEIDLRTQLQKILFEERKHPLIRSNFRFSERYQRSDDVHNLMLLGFGVLLGLENWGQDLEYKITQKTLDMAGDAKRFLPREEYAYLISLGEKLSGGVRK